MPKEVLFGIQLNSDGDVYFSMSNKEWFYKIFTGPQDGITTDIVSKDQYACNVSLPADNNLKKGTIIAPTYLNDLKKNMKDVGGGQIMIKIGHIPDPLLKKDLEGNLIIIKNGMICYYTYFVNIDRSQWDLLPTGLYTDTVVSDEPVSDTLYKKPLFYTQKLLFTIPFLKNKTTYSVADIKPLYDSLRLTGYSIKSIQIRAYSSIEGTVQTNTLLQQQRARSIVKALQQFQSPAINTTITTSDNWMEFYNDIAQSPFKDLAALPKAEVRKKLFDQTLLEQLEPYLKNHRKAIVTIYLNKKNDLEKIKTDSLIARFKNAIANKKPSTASIIQDAIFDRVANGKLPETYINQLEIPNEVIFSDLKNNQVTYKFMLNITYEAEAIEELKEIEALAPGNGRVKYNICALTFRLWRYDSSYVQPPGFLNYIKSLGTTGIDSSLIKRLLINYYIIMSDIYMDRYDYDAKDRAVEFIHRNYATMPLTDADRLSLAKYLCYYSQRPWAEQLLEKRITSIDVTEDLLFYYLNIKLFEPESFQLEPVKKAALNAISINGKRFCRLFNSVNRGGASFQLLNYDHLRKIYCENCRL